MFKNKKFNYGRDNYEKSRISASHCIYFQEDDEDEQVDPVLLSCYNCIYRRWLSDSFECKNSNK